MVAFNLKFGQMRARAQPGTGFKDEGMKGYKMVHVPKKPMGMLQVKSARDKSSTGPYFADRLGNIYVTDPNDIATISGIGWPIFDGPPNQTGAVSPDQLVWPNKVENLLSQEKNPYERRIMEALALI